MSRKFTVLLILKQRGVLLRASSKSLIALQMVHITASALISIITCLCHVNVPFYEGTLSFMAMNAS